MSIVKRLFLLLWLISPLAMSTNLVFDTAGNIIGSYVGPRSIPADWIVSGGRIAGADGAFGAIATSAGSAIVPTAAGELAVPIVSEAAFSAAAIAGIAVKIGRVASGVGAAYTAYEIYNAIKQSGLTVCPAPAFFCVPDKTSVQPASVTSGWHDDANAGPGVTFSSGQALCDYVATKKFIGYTSVFVADPSPSSGNSGSGACQIRIGLFADASYPTTQDRQTCPAQYTLGNSVCRADFPKLLPAQDSDVMKAVQDRQKASPEYSAQIYRAGQSDLKNHPGLMSPADMVPNDTGLSTTSGPVTSPKQRVSTSQISNSDGTTSTVNVDTQSTVTPQTTGSQVSNSNTQFPITTTTTTTTINNTTNVTNITTTTNTPPVINNNNPGQPVPAADTGPKECGTPGKPKCQIDETGTPTAEDYKQGAEDDLKTSSDKNTEKTAVITGITQASVGMFDWFPRIQSSRCVDPQVPEIISKTMHTVPICGAVNTVSQFLSAVMAFFALIGSVRNVQEALKA